MDLLSKKDIIPPLFKDVDFLESLSRDFGDDELHAIYYLYYQGYENIPLGQYGDVCQCFGHWLADEIKESGINVLSIQPFLHGKAMGRKDSLRFRSRFGLVISCDDQDEHIEPFKKEAFFPWVSMNFEGRSILVTSEVYDKEETLKILTQFVDLNTTEVWIIGRVCIHEDPL